MKKNTKVSTIEVIKDKEGKISIKTDMETIPVDAVNEIIDGIEDRAFNEALHKLWSVVGDSVEDTVKRYVRPWMITAIIEFILILVLVIRGI